MPGPNPRTTANRRSPVHPLSHTTPQSTHCLQWGAPYFSRKIRLPMGRSTNPTTCLIPGPVRPTTPNGIQIPSAVLPQSTGQTDEGRQTTDGWRECSVTKAAIRYASQPSNKSHGRRESDLIPVPTDVHRTAKGERGYNTPVTLV